MFANSIIMRELKVKSVIVENFLSVSENATPKFCCSMDKTPSSRIKGWQFQTDKEVV